MTKRGGDLRIPAAILILVLLLMMSACGEQTQEVVATDDDTLTAMSFNVYVGDENAKRRDSVLQTILNDMPDTPDMLSKYEDSNYYRIYTYAILRDKATGKEIVAVNTHLDNSNQTMRQKQWTVLLEELE